MKNLSQGAAEAPVDTHDGCLICHTTRTPGRAYRPHTLDESCWCCFADPDTRMISTCWLPKAYFSPVKVIEEG